VYASLYIGNGYVDTPISLDIVEEEVQGGGEHHAVSDMARQLATKVFKKMTEMKEP